VRVAVVGAGAVGVLLGVQLEHQKHEVLYLVRKGRKERMKQLLLVHAASGETRCRERPTVYEDGDAVPPFEWALLCVRGDQVEEAARSAIAHLGAPAIGVAAARLDAVEAVRRVHAHPVFAIAPTFLVWSEEPNVWRWFLPPLVKTMVSGEGDPRADERAKEFAAALHAAGLPARAVPSVRRATAAPMATGVALLAGWELADWDIARLARDGALRKLTARAMGEAAKLARTDGDHLGKLLAFAPGMALDLVLATAPRVMPRNVDAMWRVHGPKIRAQTRRVLDELLAKAEASRSPHLREIRGKLPLVT